MRKYLFMMLAVFAAGCADGGNVLRPTPIENPGPMGPPNMTLYVEKTGPELLQDKFGGNLKLGLESQPTDPNDSLAFLEVRSYACGELQQYRTSVYNSQWELNADITLVKDVRACGGTIEFELMIITFKGERIFHTFDKVALQAISGIQGNRLVVVDGPLGHKRVTGRLE